MAQLAGPWPLLHYQPVLDAGGKTIQLGRGSFGAVYLYFDSRADREVAIKRLPLTDLTPHRAQMLIRYLPSE
jgi:hypothetical protein